MWNQRFLGHRFGHTMKPYLVDYRPVKFGSMKFRISVPSTFLSLFIHKRFSSERYVNRLSIEGLQMFSLGQSNAPYTIAVYVKGKKVEFSFVFAFVWENIFSIMFRAFRIVFDFYRIRIWKQQLQAKVFLISKMWTWNGISKVRTKQSFSYVKCFLCRISIARFMQYGHVGKQLLWWYNASSFESKRRQ